MSEVYPIVSPSVSIKEAMNAATFACPPELDVMFLPYSPFPASANKSEFRNTRYELLIRTLRGSNVESTVVINSDYSVIITGSK
jgi:hypothetical protein